jgi:SAM-dependent methyltransferase
VAASADPQAIRAFEHAQWQRAAANYATTFATATSPFIEPLLDAAWVARGTRLLDIACGPGFVASGAARRGADPRGLDFSPAMLALARTREASLRFDEGDAEKLPYCDAAFDAVVANFGIHHVPRPIVALREAHRVLRKDGRIAISFWAEPTENIAWRLVFDAIAQHGDRAASGAPAPGGGFATAAQCADALRAAGFTNCETRLARAIWQHRDASSLVTALRAGTARMAALLEAQQPAAMDAIMADIAVNAEVYRNRDGIAVPIAAVIASGIRR